MSTAVTINDVTPRTQLIASSLQQVFNTNWTANVASDILVYARATATTANDVTQLISSSDYNVTFIGGSETVRVTFTVGRTLNDVVTIVRNTPADRLNLYTNTNFTPSMLNNDSGILTLVEQQSKMYDTVISLRYNVSTTLEDVTDTVLPLLGANQIWAKNAGNTAFIAYNVPSGGSVAPGNAQYLIQVAHAEAPNAQIMGDLVSGIVVNTNATGVQLTRTITGTNNQITITNGSGISGNPSVAIASNPIIPGIEGVVLPSGTTAERPAVPINGEFRYNTTTTLIEYYNGAVWIGLGDGGVVDSITGTVNQINVDLTDSAIPILSLSSTLNLPGTFAIQGTTAISAIINDSSLATATATNVSTAAAMKAYIDSVARGLNIQGSCVAASTTALTVTYDNGASGVGATLTNAGVQAAISLDGASPTAGQRVLIKNQASTLQNGIFTVTTVGSGATNWVLTRATDFDTPAEIQPGDLVILTGGTTQTNSSWLQTATVITIGTDDIAFIQFSASVPVSVSNGGTGLTSLAAFRLLAGGTTSTGAMQQVADGASGTLLQSAGAGALAAYTTTTYPATNAVSTILYASATNVMSALATANSAVLLTGATGIPVLSGTMTDGQLIIGSTGATPVAASLTAGTGITITPSAGGITIEASGGTSNGLISINTYSSSTTWNRPSGCTRVFIECLGGGGGGGAGTTDNQIGTGGSGGGFGQLTLDVTAIASAVITIGAAGSSGGGAGGNGGTSSFAANISCTGGTGGFANGSNSVPDAGTSSGGDINAMGQHGGAGGASVTARFGYGGQGASSPYGGGGKRSPGAGGGGYAGIGHGSGGGGGWRDVTTVRDGGVGTVGLVRVWNYS